MCGAGIELIFRLILMQRVVAVPYSCWVDHKNFPESASIACGLLKQLPFYVIDNNAMLPGKKLTGCQEPLPRPGWPNNQQVPYFSPLFCWTHANIPLKQEKQFLRP